METSAALNLAGVEPRSLHSFTQGAYMDYAMYVILDRALPHIGDGLKPVQRRIIYAMSELGLSHLSKHKKSARTVGDVLGKYHPHGDAACYEAMVLMAQPFSYRYPFVDGQGNWGSTDDPKSFAAMRYTEARLSSYAKSLLDELGDGATDWVPNFDGTMNEPAMLPAQLPNVLLNGSTGIAVGMATDIPPHNSKEVIDACLHLIKHPNASVDKLMQFVPGPDYPTEAEIITPSENIRQMYEEGSGSIRMRAVYHVHEGEVVITALPHQVSGSKILEQIAAQMQAKKLPMIADLRDESDEAHPVSIVITPRSNRVDIPGVMSHLFATTDLERTYRVNLNMIGLNGRPQVKGLREILNEWLTFRIDVVRRRLEYRLEAVIDRLHILDGLMIAYLNIDEVIAIIREYDEPKEELMARFGLTDVQANAILELKLKHLAKLEEMKISGEQNELSQERDMLNERLSSEDKMKAFLAEELREAKKKYGDDRRAPIVARDEAKAIKAEALLPVETVTAVLSKQGWIRCAKGADIEGQSLQYKSGDAFLSSVSGKSNQMVTFLDSTGRSYSALAQSLPSARGQGEPLSGRFQLPHQAKIQHMLMGDTEQKVLFGTSAGFGFISSLQEMVSKNKAGKALLTVQEGASVMQPLLLDQLEGKRLALATKQGRFLLMPLSECPMLAKGKGNMLVKVLLQEMQAGHDGLVAWQVVDETDVLKIYSGKHYLKMSPTDLEAFYSGRGRRGVLLPKGYRQVSRLEVEG